MKNYRLDLLKIIAPTVLAVFSANVLADMTVTGVSCSSVTSSTDGSGNVTITCSATPTAPGVPALGTVTPGNGEVSVGFTPGSGGAATNYTVTCTDASNNVVSRIGTTSPITVPGLINDATTTCVVTASNTIGTSSASTSIKVLPSATAPATSPAAPVIGAATPLDSSASIAFTPGANGGSPITSYTVSCAPTGSKSGVTSPLTAEGMTNGILHSCSVTATNAVGQSAPSGSVSVTPVAGGTVTVPAAPTIGAAIGSGTTASVSFTANSNGGSPILYYTANCDGAVPTSQTIGTGSPLVVTGIANLGAYNCRVTASNSVGTSSPSSNASVQWGTVPGAPTGVTAALVSVSSATISFTPGAAGSTATDQYRATCTGGITGTAATSPITVNGLSVGSTYTCTVAAHNSVGWSIESPMSNGVTPSSGTAPSAPGTPTATAGNASLTLAFSAPSSTGTGANGAAATITGYNASCSPSGSGSGSSSPLSVSGLINGTAYTCTVTATNSAGLTGPASNVSNSATPVAGVSCAPGETFNLGATPPDKDWTDFNTSLSTNFPSFQAKYATGTAVRFVPNTSIIPNASLQILSGYGTGATLTKEVVVSTCPHNFTPVNNNSYCRRTTIQYGYINMYFKDATHTTPLSYDCALDNNKTYYINVRNYSTTGTYNEVSTVLNLDPHL